MENKKLQPHYQEVIDFVATFQNEKGDQVSISSKEELVYPVREEFFIPYEEYSESTILYGLSM